MNKHHCTLVASLALALVAVPAAAMAQQQQGQPGQMDQPGQYGQQHRGPQQQQRQPGQMDQPGQYGQQQQDEQRRRGQLHGAQSPQQLAQQPELQHLLTELPDNARDAIMKAAQAQGGHVVGLERETRNGTTTFEAHILRGDTRYEMKVDSNGKLLKWTPETR